MNLANDELTTLMRNDGFDNLLVSSAAAAVGFVLLAVHSAQAVDYRTVVLTGDAAPGASSSFDGFESPQLNVSGQVSFAATAQGTPGVWAESGAGLGLVALAGVTNPGAGGGVNFSFFDSPVVNDSGATTFVGFLTGAGVNLDNNSGVWSTSGGALSLLARAGAAAPGTGDGGVSGGPPGTIATSATQPIVDLDNLDELDADGSRTEAIRPLQRTGLLSRVIGQSFTPSATKTLDSIVLLADTAENFDAGTHVLQLAIFEQTTPDGDGNQLTDPGGDTLLGAIETFDLAGLSWGPNTFLTLNLNTPVEISAGQEHHFELWFTTDDPSHNINFDRSENVGSSVATDGILVVSQINANDPPPSFPVGDAIEVDGGAGNRDLDYGFIYSASSGIQDNFAVLGSPTINQQGRVAFFATLRGGDVVEGADDNGVWATDENGDLQLIVRAGDPAPGVADGSVFSLLSSRPALADDGRLTFQSTLAGPAVNQTNASGIWSEDSAGDLQLVARAGDAAPGTSADYGALTTAPSANNQAQVAFAAGLLGAGVTAANNFAIWSNRSGPVELVVREGDVAPGLAGLTIGDLSNSTPVLGDGGDLAFRAQLAGTGVDSSNNASLWKSDGAGLELIAREGDAAPGVTDNATFVRFENDLLMNSLGQTAFIAALSGPGVTPANGLGIWAEDADGVLRLVARLGDTLDVEDTSGVDERVITELALVSPDNALAGSSPAFTDDGLLAFYAAFADESSGIFVADLSIGALPGDYNGDGLVDAVDYAVWRENLGTVGPAGDGTGPGLNGVPDGAVDSFDFSFWRANYGASAAAVTANLAGRTVPEPAGSLLALLAALCGWVRRRPVLAPVATRQAAGEQRVSPTAHLGFRTGGF